MNDEIRRRLEEAGGRPVDAPDPAFTDALEARLLAVAASLPPEPPRRRRPAGLRFTLGGALLTGTAAVAVLLAIAFGAGRPVAPAELSAPVNVEVALDDGTILEDPDGLRLPEGAVVRVGAGGSARIGDTVLTPGDVATVKDGRLRVEHDQPVGVATGSASTGPGSRGTPSPRPAATPSRTPGRPGTTHTPAPSPTATDPAPSPPPRPRPTPAPTPTTGPVATPRPHRTAPPPTAKPKPSPAVARPRLRAHVLFAPPRVRVTWNAVPGAKSYVLVRTVSRSGAAPRPRYPGGRIIGTFAHPPASPLRFRVPDGVVQVKLLLVVLGPDGAVLVRSRIVTLATAPAAAVSSGSASPTAPIGD